MSVKHINSLPEFNDVLRAAGAKLVVVDFHATWCGPCHAIAPRYEQLARQYAGRAIFLKVDVDAAEDVARHFSISAMPTFNFHLHSRLVEQISGADPDALADTIARHAPNAADVSFSGGGHRLSAAASDATPAPASAPAQSPQSSRQVAAAAAAHRMEAARAARAVAAAAAAADPVPDKPRAASSSASDAPARAPVPATSAAGQPGSSADKAMANDSRLKVNEMFLAQMVAEMGFPRVRAEKALILTGNSSLEAAVEWCFEHADDPDVDEPLQVVTKEGAPKTKLSPEEAKKRADDLMRRAREKREVEDKKDAIERERQRLRSGKEATMARQKLEDEERKRVVEQKRREKREALAQRQRVRDMLEADKQRRHERFNMGPAARSAPPPVQQQPIQPRSQPPSAAATAGKIQFRMPDGSRLEGEFEAEHTVGDLVNFLVAKRPELGARDIKLSQQYPRKVFSQADYSRSLADLKLLPRGALTVSL